MDAVRLLIMIGGTAPSRILKGRFARSNRGKLLGGCSSTNATFALRGHPADYDDWALAGNIGWSFSDVLPYFCRLETDADFGSAEWHGSAGPLPIRRYADDELSDVAMAGLEALEGVRLSQNS
jgi:choline dehydrogenase